MGDISYAVFVDSHRIPSSLLFLCGFLYRDPAGTVLRFQQVREGPAIFKGMLYVPIWQYLGSSVRLRLACVPNSMLRQLKSLILQQELV